MDPPEVLVLSKRYDPATLAHADDLAAKVGTTIVLDLCDNHFQHQSDPEGELARRADHLRAAISRVGMVTTASQALADVVQAECPQGPPVRVVDDAAEAPTAMPWWARLTPGVAAAELRGLARWHAGLTQVALSRRFVWFGNHGSPGVDGGMSDLARLRADLDTSLQTTGPLCVTIVSNSRSKYEEVTRGWTVPTRYVEWNAASFSPVLQSHSAALIPVSLNPFTVCKTANRVLTAYQHGLNVIADSIPSYATFKTCAVLDDWDFGLNKYTELPERRRADAAEGARIARENYNLAAITRQWIDALVAARKPAGQIRTMS